MRPSVLGTALACKMVAYVVFAPIVGGLAHRFHRKRFLIGMDLVRAGIIVAMPFATAVWHLYGLIFLLSLFSAGFKPVYAATIPELLPNERQYTRALAMSRLAYDLENVLSPTFAALALLVLSYTGLFVANAVAFLISAVLIFATALPSAAEVFRRGAIADEIGFGIRAYLKTPRLRGLLALYMGVASASAMVIVNTVTYIRDHPRWQRVGRCHGPRGCRRWIDDCGARSTQGVGSHSGTPRDAVRGPGHGGRAWTPVNRTVVYRRVADLVRHRIRLVVGSDTGR